MIVKITLVVSCTLLAIVYGITGTSNGNNETSARMSSKKKKKLPPGPRGYPFFGVSLNIDSKRIHHHFQNWKQEYGNIFMTKMMGKNIVVISCPNLLRKAFSSEEFSPFLSDRPLNFIGDVILYGYKDILLRRYDETFIETKTLLWKHMSLQDFNSVHYHHLAGEELQRVVSQLKKTEGEAVNPMDVLMTSFCIMAGMFFFGQRLTPEDHLVECISKIDEYGDTMIRPNVHNVYKLFPWIRKCCGYYGNLYRNLVSERDALFQHVKEFRQSKESEGHGLVYGLINSDAYRLTDEHVNGILVDLINTSTLTTKSVMSGFIHLWLHFPDVQRKIREEIDNVIGRERQPHIRDIDAMPYTIACIYETLRYQSHLPLTAPHANLSQEVEFEGMTIPKGSIIFGNLFSIHHDEKIWGDPWKFRPERYLSDDGTTVLKEHEARKNNVAFGVGKRKCIGRNTAFHRTFLYTTYLLQAFEFLPENEAALPSHDPREMVLESPVLLPPSFKCRLVPR